MWTAGPSPRHSAVTRDGGCAQDAAARYSAHHWTTIMTLEQRRNYGARENRAKGAVSIDSSASAALLRQRATCRTTWKPRSGRLKRTRCSKSRFQAGCRYRRRDRSCAQPCLDSRTHRFVRRQFQREPQCAGGHAKALQRRFECRSGAGSRLAQDPVGFDQPIGLKSVGR